MAEPGSAALAVIPEDERNLRGLELAERHFPPERRAQVAAFLDVPPEAPAMLPFLAFCASLNLSPIAGHAWLIPLKIRAKDGEPERTMYKVAIGRDGLLHKARETKGLPGGYRGMSFDVVCAGDTFEVERSIDPGMPPKVLHRYASKPTVFADGVSPDRYRGRIIGAWACCYVDGEPPTFYFANLREHGRLDQVWAYNPEARKRRPLYFDEQGQQTFSEFGPGSVPRRPVQEWSGAWDYTSTMVLKAAQSYVLRIALGVTGVVPVDELRDVDAWKRGDEGPDTGVVREVGEFAWDSIGDDEARERLRHAVEVANEQAPFSWAPAKCEMAFGGRSRDELLAIAARIEEENDILAERIDRVSREGEVVDGELVPEPEPSSEGAPERSQEVDQGRVDVLRAKRAQLIAGRMTATEEQQSDVIAELDQVEAELREALGLEPGADLG